MVKLLSTRKARFKAALVRVGMTQHDWAVQQGITRGYLNMVLNERMQSRSLIEKVDAFIQEVESKVAA